MFEVLGDFVMGVIVACNEFVNGPVTSSRNCKGRDFT